MVASRSRIQPMRLPVLTILLTVLAGSAAAADRPNIIFIMSDDHAAHAISAYGSRVNTTPNIDRLAREGMRFDNVFVTNSICTPSRAAILTGQYAHRNGVPVFNRFDSSRQTVARLLQAGGYYTGMIGKWHLGSDPGGLRPLGDPARPGRLHGPGALHGDRREDLQRPLRDRRHHGPGSRLHPDTPVGEAVLPDDAPQGAAPELGAGGKVPESLRDALDPGAANVVGLVRHPDRRAARESAAGQRRPDAQ